jgi:hypothetical protein
MSLNDVNDVFFLDVGCGHPSPHPTSKKIGCRPLDLSKFAQIFIKNIYKHVIRIFGMVFCRKNIYPYF